MPIGNSSTQTKTGFYHSLGKVLTEVNNAPGNEKYKSAHSVISSEIWTTPVSYSPTLASASSYATGSPVTQIGSVITPTFLYPLSGTNYQSWFLDSGTPSWFPDGFIPSDSWNKPLINPADVPNGAGAPSFGFDLSMYQRNATTIPYGNAYYDVDYYAGIVKFDTGKTPKDSGNGLGFVFNSATFEVQGSFAAAKAYLTSTITGGPRALAFQYTGAYLSNIALNPAVGSEPFILSLTALNTLVDNSTASNTSITHNPVGEVLVFLNGQKQKLGYNSVTAECYFATSSVSSARATEADVLAGDYLYWNQSITGFELSNTDELSLYYNKPSV